MFYHSFDQILDKVRENPVKRKVAVALAAMNREGLIPNCHVVGPISYDIAMSADIAREKKYDCTYYIKTGRRALPVSMVNISRYHPDLYRFCRSPF